MPIGPTLVGKSSLSDKDAETIARSFKEAMKGFGTDEQRIIKEICALTNAQRQIVEDKYQTLYGHTLEEDLKSELKGDFEDIIIALLKPRFEYEAECIKDALKGFGTREHVVIEILCTKESAEIEKLKENYKRIYGSDLEDDLRGEEDGPLGRVFRSIATADRPTGPGVDMALAQKEAQELYDAGEGKFGTEENELVRILVSRSFAQLKATFDQYQTLAGKNIEDAIKSETEGHLEDALIAIVQSIRDRGAYYARQIQRCIKMPGTKEKDLIRIIVSRCEVDMGDIKKDYKDLFGKSLYDDLKQELRGDFEEIVLKLVGTD